MSKKKTPCPTDIIAAERERWDQWRRDHKPEALTPEPVEVLRVRDIATALEYMQWDEPDSPEVAALALAVCDQRWDLIRKATFMLEREWLPRNDPRRMTEDAKWLAFCLASLESPKLGKGDILEYVEKVHPDIFKAIPRTMKARSVWWAEVGGEQVRGDASPEWRRQFKELISRGIDNRKAGFPDFLGPRENPNWE
jgi:hypothetical protein